MTKKISKAAWAKSKEICAPSGETPLNLGYELDVVRHRVAAYVQEVSDVVKLAVNGLPEGWARRAVQSLILPDDEPTPEDVLMKAAAVSWPYDKLKDCEAKSLAAALDAVGYKLVKKEP